MIHIIFNPIKNNFSTEMIKLEIAYLVEQIMSVKSISDSSKSILIKIANEFMESIISLIAKENDKINKIIIINQSEFRIIINDNNTINLISVIGIDIKDNGLINHWVKSKCYLKKCCYEADSFTSLITTEEKEINDININTTYLNHYNTNRFIKSITIPDIYIVMFDVETKEVTALFDSNEIVFKGSIYDFVVNFKNTFPFLENINCKNTNELDNYEYETSNCKIKILTNNKHIIKINFENSTH